MESGDGVAAAAAVEGASELRPGVSPAGISLSLARHFTRTGRPDQSVPFFQKALRENEAATNVTFEMALAHEEMGDCRRALVFFEQIRRDVTPAQRSEVDWNIGNCSAELAEEAEVDEDFEEALRLYRITISIGEPRDRLGEAWFRVGEILSARGDCQAAVEAFEQVRRQELSGGLLADRARARIDEIRFGRGC
jgi:tetratricopeptide (TPR) repeat protein